MTAEDHREEAESLLARAEDCITSDPSSGVERLLMAAQVHATLALGAS